MRFAWLLVAVFPWLVAASYVSKQTIQQTRKYPNKDDFVRRLQNVPGEEEILMERIGASVARVSAIERDGETALVMENVVSKSEISNVLVREAVGEGGRMRRQVDQEDIRRALCRAATVGEFFRLVHDTVLLL